MAKDADRVCYGGAYGSLQPPPSVLKKTPNPTRPCEEQGGAASQDKEQRHGGRGEAAGDCVFANLSLFARRRRSCSTGFPSTVRDYAVFGVMPPARFDGKWQQPDEHLHYRRWQHQSPVQKESKRERGRGRHRTPRLCRTQARRINCNEIATITSDDDTGASARSAKGVFT